MLRLLVILVVLAGALGASTIETDHNDLHKGMEAAIASTGQVCRFPAKPSNCCRPLAQLLDGHVHNR